MVNYFDEDFSVEAKVKNGVKQKGKGGSKKNMSTRKKASNTNKQMYNSKHIRIQAEKIEKCKLKKPNSKNE